MLIALDSSIEFIFLNLPLVNPIFTYSGTLKTLRKQPVKIAGKATLEEFEYKQVIIFRSDLKLSKGKIAAQAGHAAVSGAQEAHKRHRDWWDSWLFEGQRKVAVKVKDEKELLELEDQANVLGLPNALIVDRGLTEIPPGTVTCLAIGPAPTEKIDRLTGELPLL
jgi:PTH2 family peptidyl-tRNA hydrolase